MKKLIISSEVLRPILSKLAQVVSPKSLLPAAANLLCMVSAKEVEFIGTNGEITIKVKAECESVAEFEFLLPFEFITQLVDLHRQTPIEINAEKKLKILIQDEVYDRKVADKLEEFPKIPQIPQKGSLEIDAAAMACLKTALATVAPQHYNRPLLTNVLLQLSEGKISIASTDAAYHLYSMDIEKEVKEKEQFLLSKKLISILDTTKAAKINYHSKHIAFEQENTIVIATRSNESYSDYLKSFPVDWPVNLTIQKDLFVQALQKCALAKDELHKTVLNFKTKGAIKFAASDHQTKVSLSVPAEYEGKVEAMAIQNDAVLRVLGQIPSFDVELALHEASRAVVITSKDVPGYKGLFFPIAL